MSRFGAPHFQTETKVTSASGLSVGSNHGTKLVPFVGDIVKEDANNTEILIFFSLYYKR